MRAVRLLQAALLTVTAFAAEPTSLEEAVAAGKFSVNARLRYEGVTQAGPRDANALTLRTRLGYTTASLRGWRAMAELENITAADGDAYSQAGLNAGGAGRASVGDPETTELNQAYLSYQRGETTVSAGRQRLVLDNARFVGEGTWRQNQQTFDAITAQDRSFAKTTFTYAYLNRIHRTVGDRHPQGNWASCSHIFNAAYAGLPGGTLAGYGYLLDLPGSRANSCATYGATFSGSAVISGDFRLLHRLEFARQTDHGSSPLSYSAGYHSLELGLGVPAGSLTLGQERLGADRTAAFRTPIATLHAFNGWADVFTTTPAAGLRDGYARASLNLPAAVTLNVIFHRFTLDRTGARAGDEWNAQLIRKFGAAWTAMAKYADFRRDAAAFSNVHKLWFQLEFTR
ncbi:MAG: alginate export family protein [Opitutaceae bacterium]